MNACRASGNCPTGLVHTRDLYTAKELQTSPTYNEALPRGGCQDALVVRLDGSHIGRNIGDPVDSDGWGSSRISATRACVQGSVHRAVELDGDETTCGS